LAARAPRSAGLDQFERAPLCPFPFPRGVVKTRQMSRDLCLILDFGSQYTQLIARRVRELKVYSEIHPFDLGLEKIRALAPRAIVLSGGPSSVYEPNAPSVDVALFDLGVPILGICYGVQLACKLLGGQVAGSDKRE